MLKFSKTSNNTVVFEFAGVQTLEAHQQSLTKMSAVLDEYESVILVRMYHDTQSLILSDELAELTTIWLENGGSEQIRLRVAAMLYIVPDELLLEMKDVDVFKIFGVKGGIFGDRHDAIEWLKVNIDSGLHWELPANIDS